MNPIELHRLHPLPSTEEILSLHGVDRGGEVRHTEMARKLGVHASTIRALYKRGGLPGAREHSPRVLMVPRRLLLLAGQYGLRRLELMAKQGILQKLWP